MIKFWKFLRPLTFALLVASPILIAGCGDGGATGPGAEIPAEEDPTLDPETDSTMVTEEGAG